MDNVQWIFSGIGIEVKVKQIGTEINRGFYDGFNDRIAAKAMSRVRSS